MEGDDAARDRELVELVRILNEVMDDLRHRPTTEQVDVVLCLLEAAQQLLPAAISGQRLTIADVAEIRSCVRAAEISVRSHLWRHGRVQAHSV